MNYHSFSIVIIIALILFSIFRRIRRNIGWQQLNQRRLLFRIVLLAVVGMAFFTEGIFHPISLISDITGVLVGSILAFYSASLTSLEKREECLYYRPNIWIGGMVTFIFLARFIYRFYGIVMEEKMNGWKKVQTNGIQDFSYAIGHSWTAGLILIMFAYYVIYYVILLKKAKTIA